MSINTQRADELTVTYTAFDSFTNIVINAFSTYRPSLHCNHRVYGNDLTELADLYDQAQEQRDDARRAFRF